MFLDEDIEIQEYEGTWLIEFTELGNYKCTNNNNVIFYKLNKLPHQLTDNERIEVLDYRLGSNNYDINELVSLSDIFIHGVHITKI